jgi:hypothetical protein
MSLTEYPKGKISVKREYLVILREEIYSGKKLITVREKNILRLLKERFPL